MLTSALETIGKAIEDISLYDITVDLSGVTMERYVWSCVNEENTRNHTRD